MDFSDRFCPHCFLAQQHTIQEALFPHLTERQFMYKDVPEMIFADGHRLDVQAGPGTLSYPQKRLKEMAWSVYEVRGGTDDADLNIFRAITGKQCGSWSIPLMDLHGIIVAHGGLVNLR